MNRKFRLSRSIDFKRVRRQGSSFAHPLVVLVRSSSTGLRSRVGISVSRFVGNAVVRNRTKRVVREILRSTISDLAEANDLVIIARPAIATATFSEIKMALMDLLKRSRIIHPISGQ